MLSSTPCSLFHSFHEHAGQHFFEFKRVPIEGGEPKWFYRWRFTPEVWTEVPADTFVWDADHGGRCWATKDGTNMILAPMHVSKEWRKLPYPLYLTRKDDRFAIHSSYNYAIPDREPDPEGATAEVEELVGGAGA